MKELDVKELIAAMERSTSMGDINKIAEKMLALAKRQKPREGLGSG